jgi:lysylphosphatidylglycerol synthetase-like protein (DUF2156 family)
MAKITQYYVSPVTTSIETLLKYLADRRLITDLVTKLVITFGTVLIVGGLYLMLSAAQTYAAVQTIVSSIAWVPGIPFAMGELTNVGSSIIGLVAWLVGIDLLLVGLGLWVRHRLARFTALIIFVLAACFQFVQFVESGILGSPGSAASLLANVILAYFLYSRFDSAKLLKNKLAPSSQLTAT